MRILSAAAVWLLRGGIARWIGVLVAFAIAGAIVRPIMGPATATLFGLLVVLGLLIIIYRVMLRGGSRKR